MGTERLEQPIAEAFGVRAAALTGWEKARRTVWAGRAQARSLQSMRSGEHRLLRRGAPDAGSVNASQRCGYRVCPQVT